MLPATKIGGGSGERYRDLEDVSCRILWDSFGCESWACSQVDGTLLPFPSGSWLHACPLAVLWNDIETNSPSATEGDGVGEKTVLSI